MINTSFGSSSSRYFLSGYRPNKQALLQQETRFTGNKHPHSGGMSAGGLATRLLLAAGGLGLVANASPISRKDVSPTTLSHHSNADGDVFSLSDVSRPVLKTGITIRDNSNTSWTDHQALEILKLPIAFNALDQNLFRQGVYPSATAYPPAAAPATPKTEQQWKDFISVTLEQLYRSNESAHSKRTHQKKTEKIANLINDPKLIKAVPDIRLRVAVALLDGTAAKAAIPALQSGHYKVEFDNNMDPKNMAETNPLTDPSSNATRRITINGRYQDEDPRVAASLLSHEVSHSDGTDSLNEEITNEAVASLIHGQFVLADPTFPLQKTEGLQRRNTLLLARINDRVNGELALEKADAPNIYNSTNIELPDFAAAEAVNIGSAVSETSPVNPYINAVVKEITGKGFKGSTYNDTTAALDKGQKLFSPKKVLTLARNLKLDIPPVAKA